MFTCFLPVWTPRAQGWKGYHEAAICPKLQSVLFIHFVAWGTFDLLHFTVWFPTPIFHRRHVLGESQKERRTDKVAGVCEKAEDFFWPLNIALKDLLQGSILGFGWESNTDLDLFVVLQKKTKCFGWGGRNAENPSPWETTTHSSLVLSKCSLTIFLSYV